MIAEVAELIENYQEWLRGRTVLRELTGEWVEITTPYLDRHNDRVQLYTRRDDDGYVLTDDGYTLQDLELSGCPLNTPKRVELLTTTLAGFGVAQEDEALLLKCSRDSFPQAKHNLVQAMLAVNDLFCLAEPTIQSVFQEDVEAWLRAHDVRYSPKVKLSGISGYDHLFDFVVPAFRDVPERVVQTVNRPNKGSVGSVVFRCEDTRRARDSDMGAYAVLNDQQRPVSAGVVDALKSYRITPVLWSQREAVAGDLAA